MAVLATGRTLALANKESLVVGGPLVTSAAAPDQIVAVDSEHSALAQCLRGGTAAEVDRLVLTASGGPFRGRRREQLADVTPEQALAHPTWTMGRVITTNSATLVNKGLELLEAHLLYGVDLDRIDVVVHPQSMVHSMVQFIDGSTLAQCSPPDMKLPIALGLSWPDRLPGVARPCDWSTASSWTFEPLDNDAFPAVELAREAGRLAGTAPAVYNAANEICVDAFHDGRLGFLGIIDIVDQVLHEHVGARAAPIPLAGDVGSTLAGNAELTLEVVLAADAWARARAGQLVIGPGAQALDGHRDLHRRCRRLLRPGDGVDRAARDRAPGAGQDLRRQDHPVLRRVRPDTLVTPARRDRVRVQARPARRLRPVRRDVPARPRAIPARCGSTAPARSARWPTTPAPRSGRDISAADDGRLFYQKKSWQKLIIMAGGPTMNILLAFVILLGVTASYGVYRSQLTVNRVQECIVAANATDQSCDGKAPTPAARSGIQAGDRVVAFNGVAVSSWDEVSTLIRANLDHPAQLTVDRNGSRVDLTAGEHRDHRCGRQVRPLQAGRGRVLRRRAGGRPASGAARSTSSATCGR